MDVKEFLDIAQQKFPWLDDVMRSRFIEMEGLYNEWNAKINVISRKDIDSLYARHILHSLSIAGYLKEMRPGVCDRWRGGVSIETSKCSSECGPGDSEKGLSARNGLERQVSVLDLGTGGGFPGIPLAVLFPQTQFTLCDSVGKKTIVANAVAKSLGLENVKVVNARAESLPEMFDLVVSRAVTALDNFWPWVSGKFTENIFYLKGGDFAEELCKTMSMAHLAPGSVRTWKIADWFSDPLFDEKYVIDIPASSSRKI